MANARPFPTAATATAASRTTAASPASASAPTALPPARHRLRAVDRDEVVDVADFLPPGATWLPAPQHTVPSLPGHPPMVGYLVLVPAGQQPGGRLPGTRPGPGTPPAAVSAPAPSPAGPPPDVPAGESAAPAPAAAQPSQDSPDPLVRIDPDRRTAEVDGVPLDLTYLEFELLAHLVAHPQRVHTRDHLVGTVWGYGHVGDGRTVDVHVARLRRKLGAEHRQVIRTVRRVGYKYAPPAGR